MSASLFDPETEDKYFESKYLHEMIDIVIDRFPTMVEAKQFAKLFFSITEESPYDLCIFKLRIATLTSNIKKLSNNQSKLSILQNKLNIEVDKYNKLSMTLDEEIAQMKLLTKNFPPEFTSDKMFIRCMKRER